jgi:predicted nucleic acid-binding protein
VLPYSVIETITICRDPKDNKILELAVSGQASYLLSSDKDLLVLHPFQGIEIVTPADFLAKPSA